MGKTVPLTSADLDPQQAPQQVLGPTHMRQRGVPASAELDGLNFKLPVTFVRDFKQEALNRDMRLNELLTVCFQHFKKTFPGSSGP